MKAKTEIHCNRCQYLKIIKRPIKLNNRIDRNTWMLSCKHPGFDTIIDVIDVRNKDLHNIKLPDIKSPFHCPFRQKERIKGTESKFELQIK